MHILIHQIKISNFLSFFGVHEVYIKPFTTVMCNYHEGKDDFLRSLEFVLGAQPIDIRVENPLDLIHKVLREEFLANQDIQSYVEVTINLIHENKFLKFRKSLKNGSHTIRIEHRVSDVITPKLIYDEKLTSIGLNKNHKNLIFYKEYFNNVIWGSSADLETTICTCLREKCIAEDLKKARKEVEYLTRLRARTAKIHFNAMKNCHGILAKFAKKFETVFMNKERAKEEILREIANASSEEELASEMNATEEENSIDIYNIQKFEKIQRLEVKWDILSEKLDDLKFEKVTLTIQLYHEEIKSSNPEILQYRMKETKNLIREKEKTLSEIWLQIHDVSSEVEDLSNQISLILASFGEFQKNIFFQNRLTPYGRFRDYIKPGPYASLLEKILGPEIFFANFCDTFENALYTKDLFKLLKWEHRETFISFESYSHKLKDVIIASGEEGIEISTLEQLLIFLCKLKHYGLIEEVPVMVQKDFEYDDELPEGYCFYMKNSICFTEDGCICYEYNEEESDSETDSEGLEKLVQLQKEEENKCYELRDLLALKLDTLFEMSSLENDISYLKQNVKKLPVEQSKKRKGFKITEIYEEYSDIFKEHDQLWKILEEKTQEPSQSNESDDNLKLLETSNESTISVSFKLDQVVMAIKDTKNELEETTRELRDIFCGPFYELKLQKKVLDFYKSVNKSKFFFEKEFKKLQKLMTEDDFDDFVESQDWRKTMINSLIKDFNGIKTKLKAATEALEKMKSSRDRKLIPLIQHFERHLTPTFAHLLDNALPFIKFSYNASDEKLQIVSSLREGGANLIDIKYFNTFLKFVTALSIFLELAVHEKAPVMVFDDFEEYFPMHADDLTSILDPSVLEKTIPDDDNPQFQLLMRIGQYLAHYIKKNIPSTNVRNIGLNEDYINGPMQIICFTRDDFINAADHHIWIHNQMLPDEYLTEECNSYSEIHNLDFDNIALFPFKGD